MGRECPECGRELVPVPLADRDVWRCDPCSVTVAAAAATPLSERLEAQLERLRLLAPPARARAARAIAHAADAVLWNAIAERLRSLKRALVIPVSAKAFWKSVGGPASLCAAVVATMLTVLCARQGESAAIAALWFLWLFFSFAVLQPVGTIRKGRTQLRLSAYVEVLHDIIGAAHSDLAVGAIAEALRPGLLEPRDRSHLQKQLGYVLFGLWRNGRKGVSVSDQEALAALLPGPFARVHPTECALVADIAGFLATTHFAPATHALDAIAKGDDWFPAPPQKVRDAARGAAESIRKRVDELHERSWLLRAASGDDADRRALLRAATAGSEPTEQLLHEAEGGPDERQ